MLVAATVSLLLQTLSAQQLVDLARRSSVVVTCRVEKLGASTIDVPAAANTAVVYVDDVLLQPAPLTSLKGARVTVRFPSRAPTEAPVTVFGNVYIAGRSVGLDAVGVVAGPRGELREQLAAAQQTVREQAIAARVAKAEVIVSGVVHATRPLTDMKDPRQRISEHDPLWTAAEIGVDSVERGDPALKDRGLIVYFAASRDPYWSDRAKLRTGDKVIILGQMSDPWITEGFERSIAKPKGPFVIDRDDVQPIDRLELVRRLIKR
jgi:hypothetical protein